MTAPLVHLNGWPGCGKATIGRVLADRLGGRLLHNHLMLDPASALFARHDPQHAALREALRRVIFDAARGLPAQVPLILTDALSDDPADAALIAPTRALADARGADLHCVTLEIAPEENARRLTDAARRGSAKLTDPAVLADLRAKHRLLRAPGAVSPDVTQLDPGAAAEMILTLLGLPFERSPTRTGATHA